MPTHLCESHYILATPGLSALRKQALLQGDLIHRF